MQLVRKNLYVHKFSRSVKGNIHSSNKLETKIMLLLSSWLVNSTSSLRQVEKSSLCSVLGLPISIMKPSFLNAHLLIQQQQPDFFFRNHHHHQPKTMDVIKVNLQMN